MAIARLWWADDSDVALAEGRLKTLRDGQLAKWQWITWKEEDDQGNSLRSLLREITSRSMFEEGKVVLLHGLPSCHAELSEYLDEIPDGVVVVIIGGLAKNLKLYKAAKKLESENLAKVDESFKLDRSNAKAWIKERAIYYGGTVDDMAVKILFDLVGPKPNLLDGEIRKMIMMADNKHITPFIAQEACFYSGDTDVFRFCSAIVDGNRINSHELLQRLLIKGENHNKLCGYLMDWARKLAISEEFNRDYQALDKAKIEGLQKIDRDDDDPLNISLEDFNELKSLPKQRLIANTGALYYTCKELSASSKAKGWGLTIVPLVGTLMLDLRKGRSPEDCFHQFIEDAISEGTAETENEDGADNH